MKGAGRLIVSLVNLAIGIAMIDVGVQNQEACKNDGAHFLVVNGSFLVVFSILGCIAACINYHSLSAFLGGVISISGLIILIWGSVIVFGELYRIHKLHN